MAGKGCTKMIVTVVCDVLGQENNGTTIAAMNLIRSLRSKGHEVRILCPDADKANVAGYYIVPVLNVGPLNNYVKKNGVCIARGDSEIISRAIKGADVVHIMTPFLLGTKAMKIAREMGIPVTAGFHCQAENVTSHLFLKNNRLANNATYRVFYKNFYKYVDAVHYPTEFIRSTFEVKGRKTNAYVISNGVNSAFVPTPSCKPEEFKDKYIILFIGRYSKEKSHKILIDAVVQSRYAEKIQLVFAGDGPLKEKLIKQSEKLPNRPLFKFFSRTELLHMINCADLYVHPAEIEIEAISCLEAISCGLVPVISNSPRSATRFFALDEKNLFNCNDSADLAEKIDWWLSHPDEKAARSREYLGYTKQFDQEVCMNAMEQMLYDAAEHKSEGIHSEAV